MECISESSHLICNPSVRITNAMRRTGDLLLQSPWTFLSSDRILKCLKCLLSQSIPTTRSSIFIPSLQSGKWNCNQVNLPVQKQGPDDRRFTFNISTNQSLEIMRAKQRAKTVITFPVRTTGNWGIWILQYVAFTENLPSQCHLWLLITRILFGIKNENIHVF